MRRGGVLKAQENAAIPSNEQDRRGAPEGQRAGPAAATPRLRNSVAARPVQEVARSVLVAEREPANWPAQLARREDRRHRARVRVRALPWPLLAILTVQAALSLRMVWSNTAFQDEALYLWAGRLEWAHWLHGAPIPVFPTWFSGAPVIYPPLGALADGIGGLAAARALSLMFMLAVTMLLWGTTTRLFGKRAALFATALFATLANTQFLGAFATYDAMALMLIALATWLGVRSLTAGQRPRIVMLIGAASILALADAVKYAAILFDPVTVTIVSLAAWRLRGWRTSLSTGLVMSGVLLTVLLAGSLVIGPAYWQGITSTTLERPAASASTIVILERSYVWTSLVIVISVIGIVLARREGRVGRTLISALAMTDLLVPAEQVRVHTTTSLQKHVDYGAWFAVMAAGYAMGRVSQLNKGVGWAPVLFLPILAFTVYSSSGQADQLFEAWPKAASLINALRPVLKHEKRPILAEGDEYSVIPYYLGGEVSYSQLRTTYDFTYTEPRSHQVIGMPASFSDAIGNGYFGLVVLDYAGGHPVADSAITRAAEASSNCRELLNEAYVQLYVRRSLRVWSCTPPLRHHQRSRRHHG
jgi:4-amino-4-deoxy-L-arabinose transferase-like glycosyltransferase